MTSLEQSLAEWLTPSIWLANRGIELDDYQVKLVDGVKNTHVLAGRQVGKSHASACAAVQYAATHPRSLTILASYNQAQANELGLKCKEMAELCRLTVISDAITYMKLENKARILSISGLDTSARGMTAGLVIIDEASKVSSELYHALLPVQITVKGSRMILISSAWERRGFFFEVDDLHDEITWDFIKVMSKDSSRITPEKLESERRAMPEAIYQREYECKYFNILQSSLFSEQEINDCFVDGVHQVDLS